MLICPPHIPLHRVEKAVARIRAMRGVNCDKPCTWPDDLGCETQLYLGSAMFKAFPRERLHVVGQACGVGIPDAMFFAMLVSLAENSERPWMKRAIVDDAARILLGLAVEPLPIERMARNRGFAAPLAVPLDLLPGMRAPR